MVHRSHLTQELVNYFDVTDTRTRELPWTLEAQLLNAFASSIEESQVRMDRETRSTQVGKVPLNLDNGGVWYKVQVPNSIAVPQTVQGVRGSTTITLTEYDDLFPVPSGIQVDPSRSPVSLSDPALFSFTGTGTPYDSGSLVVLFPNRVYFWVSGLGDFAGTVDIQISGYPYPRTYWASAPDAVTETVTVTDEGAWQTNTTWQEIDNISVRNLPLGATVSGFILESGLPGHADPMRPYTDPAFRDVTFPRYWTIAGSLVIDEYFASRCGGFQPVQTYFTTAGALSLAVEPNTAGLLVSTASSVLYVDRREPVPDNLSETSITQEPLYGIHVEYDASQPGDLRYVNLVPVGYANAGNMTQYRFSAAMPDGTHLIITPQGNFAQYTSNGGWFRGTPSAISLSLTNSQCGSWLFTMECIDQTGNRTEDNCPYLHGGLEALVSLDVSGIVSTLAAAVFDSFEQLWLWTGTTLVPVKFTYDAYVYDSTQQAIFLTDTYDQVNLS